MKTESAIFTIAIVVLAAFSTASAQTDEVKLDPARTRITAVPAVPVRRAPKASGKEITRLKLGTIVSVVARNSKMELDAGKLDYWDRINLPNGESGWVSGGRLRDYYPSGRAETLKEIIEYLLENDHFMAGETEFANWEEIYNLASNSIAETEDANTRAEFELLKLLVLRQWAWKLPNGEEDESPHPEWLKAHAAEIIPNESGSGYQLRAELLWNLEAKNHSLPIADRIAWEAAENPLPSECENDAVCQFLADEDFSKYLNLHPSGEHAAEALKNLNEVLTDDVIAAANSAGGDENAVARRTQLKKQLAQLRVALEKVSAPEKAELVKKLGRVK